MAAVSCGTSHASAVSTPLRWIFKKRAIKSYSLMYNHMRAQWVCSRAENSAIYKSNQHHHHPFSDHAGSCLTLAFSNDYSLLCAIDSTQDRVRGIKTVPNPTLSPPDRFRIKYGSGVGHIGVSVTLREDKIKPQDSHSHRIKHYFGERGEPKPNRKRDPSTLQPSCTRLHDASRLR